MNREQILSAIGETSREISSRARAGMESVDAAKAALNGELLDLMLSSTVAAYKTFGAISEVMACATQVGESAMLFVSLGGRIAFIDPPEAKP